MNGGCGGCVLLLCGRLFLSVCGKHFYTLLVDLFGALLFSSILKRQNVDVSEAQNCEAEEVVVWMINQHEVDLSLFEGAKAEVKQILLQPIYTYLHF